MKNESNKPNILIIVGGVLCLISMVLGYVEFDALLIKVPISWYNVARFANNMLYAVPVVGVLMLLAGLSGVKAFQGVTGLAAVVVCIWYLFVHRDILQGDAVRWLCSANTMLNELIQTQGGINMEDISMAASILGMFLRLSWGYILFAVGTLLNVVGLFINPAENTSTNTRKTSTIASSTGSERY